MTTITIRALATASVLIALYGAPACSSNTEGETRSPSTGSGGKAAAGSAGSTGATAGTGPGGAGGAGGSGADGGSGGATGGSTNTGGGNSGGSSNSGGTAGSPGGSGGSGGSSGSSGGSAGSGAGMGGSSGTVGADAGSTGGSGGTAYNPCPTNGDPCKVLPLGDSITEGLQSSHRGGYRVDLFHRTLEAKQHITFVGSRQSGPQMVDGVAFPRNHEGYSGWTIDQIAGTIPSPALNGSPDIVLLMIGTNDMYRTGAAQAPQRLETLLDRILGASSHALLVVAKIIPLNSSAANVDAYNAAIPALVQKRAAQGKHIVLVDQFTGFPTSELADGVHPNDAGYRRMAGVWYAAISNLLH